MSTATKGWKPGQADVVERGRRHLEGNGTNGHAPAPSPPPASVQLPIASIEPSPTNPRKTFDPDELQELAESIKTMGVLQPILVRPGKAIVRRGPTKGLHDFYELVAGERRWRAAKLAGLAEIPAIVRDLTDKQAAEIQVTENLQRSDLDPLEEAAGYQLLIDQHGYRAEDLAAKLGKSKAYVYGRLKLGNLPRSAAEAIRQGKISVNHGILIGRLPNPKLREQATTAILHPKNWAYTGRPELQGMALTFRDAKALIEQDYMIELKGAPFDRKSLDLVPEAGSCEACPKRTGNARDEYPEARADVCTDPECYRRKVAAHLKNARARAEAKGVEVLAAGEARKALRDYGSDYVRLDRRDWNSKKTHAQVLGKKLDEVKDQVRVAFDDKGRAHKVLPQAVYDQAVGKKPADNKQASSPYERENRVRQAMLEIYRQRLWQHVRKVCDAMTIPPLPLVEVALKLAAKEELDRSESAEELAKLLKVELPESHMEHCEALLRGRDTVELLAMLLFAMIDVGFYMDPARKEIKERLEMVGLDPKALKKQAVEDLKAAEKAERAKAKAESKARQAELGKFVHEQFCLNGPGKGKNGKPSALVSKSGSLPCSRCKNILPHNPSDPAGVYVPATCYAKAQISQDVVEHAKLKAGELLCFVCIDSIIALLDEEGP